MKHIKRRFFLQTTSDQVNFDNPNFENLNIEKGITQEQLSERKDSIAYVETTDGIVIGGFVHKVDGKNYMFPVPDPTLIYFNNAQLNVKAISEQKKILLKKLDVTVALNSPAIHDIYNYYGLTSGFIIFLFTAIESFINQMIPDDFIYEDKQNRKTEIYNKAQIQEFLDFKTKITKVLKETTGKNFFINQTPTNQSIWKLKEFRDDIIHTKQDENPLKYNNIIKNSLSFNYGKTLLAVAKFMNYYKKDYIIECDCGKDF